jgi:hypothetical protein
VQRRHDPQGEFDNAVMRFRKAWEHAQKVLKAAVTQADVITDYVLEQNYPNSFSQIPP